jgi:N-acyl-D-aspartate/D-glutamate deacylase
VTTETAILIRGCTVIDGTGAPAVGADVVVVNDRIAALGADPDVPAGARVIDADGLTVAPGFIDMHSHADFTLPSYPDALNSLSQGVTTEVLGNCGYSPAPLAADEGLASGQRAAGTGLGPDLDWGWRSFGEYARRLDEARPAVDCALLVGHGMLRLAVVGGEDRAATTGELARMRTLVAVALEAGAFGLSSGLVYPPGSFASTEELVAVAEPLREAGALYASHIRSEGDGLPDALGEAVEVGQRLGVRVEVSHLKAAGRHNHGRSTEALALLDAARAEGLPVSQDVYPYTAGSTLLTQLLPPWVQDGGIDALLDRLRSPEARARIADEVPSGLPGWMSYAVASGGWQHIRIAAVTSPTLRHLEGRTLEDAARDAGMAPLDLVLDTLVADRAGTTMIVTLMDEGDVATVLQHPATSIGSDQLGVTSRTARVHPRCYGTFARVLGRFVREQQLVALPEAIRRMTSWPASVLGLSDRGRVAPGLLANLVVFDPDRVIDTATYDAPTSLATGIEAVILRGRVAVEHGEVVDARLGRVLRRGARTAQV